MTGGQARTCFLTADQVEDCLALWYRGGFNTFDIGRFLNVPEPAVCRTLQAARDIRRELHRELRS